MVVDTNAGTGADTFINAGTSANSNFGSSTQMVMKNPGSPNNFARKSYVRFDLTTLPDQRTLVNAFFRIRIGQNNQGSGNGDPKVVEFWGLNEGHAGESWDESTITWNNAPGHDTGSATGFLGGQAQLLGSLTIPHSEPVGSIVEFGGENSQIANFINADQDGQVTFMFVRTDSNSGSNLSFSTRESGFAPDLLVIRVPEPATAGLLIVGLGLLTARRRISQIDD